MPNVPREPTGSDERLTNAMVEVSRAMVGVALRSLADVPTELSLQQYRILVALISAPRRLLGVAALLAVSPAKASQMCDELVEHGLVAQARSLSDDQVGVLTATAAGSALVGRVTERRTQDVRRVIDAIPTESRRSITEALEALVLAVDASGGIV